MRLTLDVFESTRLLERQGLNGKDATRARLPLRHFLPFFFGCAGREIILGLVLSKTTLMTTYAVE